MKELIYILLVFAGSKNLYGQLTNENHIIKGKVFAENDILMFASVGIPNKNIGTITDDNGKFSLEIPTKFFKDSISISYIGYYTKKIEIESMLRVDFIEIKLKPKTSGLNEVAVVSKNRRKSKIKEFGNKKKHDSFLWFMKGDGDKGSELVVLIEPNSEISLNSVSVNILNDGSNEFTLLLNIYDLNRETDLPNNQLLQKQKLIKSNQSNGWLKVNLKNDNIIINKPFYIGFQWTEVDRHIPLIGGKTKKSTNSLIRNKTMGTWEKYLEFEWDIKVEAQVYK